MLRFNCDYMEGAHPAILKRLLETNMEQAVGYGFDPYSLSAKEKIKAICECPTAEVSLLVGGTQANATVIKSILHVSEGVIAADSAHISVHEAGAIEYTGHKVLALPGIDGKLTADSIDHFMSTFLADPTHPHMVQPGMVYISHPTEFGTLYSLAELTAIATLCNKYNLTLFMDGARLGYGLAAQGTDVTLPEIAKLCDVFYIGGTKVGALCGEAVVVTNPKLTRNFFTVIKQSGALLAKGRLLGIQFDTLFTDNLYFTISQHAITMAMKLKAALKAKGYEFYLDSPTNQQLVLLTPEQKKKLEGRVTFDMFGFDDKGREIHRFATSWATSESAVDELISLL